MKKHPQPPLDFSKALLLSAVAILTNFVLLTLSSCSTVEGVGEDLQKAGEEIENAAH
ncbi:MAG: entericidin A/B family lipoprotein [Verrucomicrobiales bacterium]